MWNSQTADDSHRFVQRKYVSVSSWEPGFCLHHSTGCNSWFYAFVEKIWLSVLDLVLLLLWDLFRRGKGFQKWNMFHVSILSTLKQYLGHLAKRQKSNRCFFFPTWPDIFQRRLHALFSSRKEKFAIRLFKKKLSEAHRNPGIAGDVTLSTLSSSLWR